MLRNQSVQVNIDNSSACRILSVGSAKPYLQNIAIDVFNFCSDLNIKLIPQWNPGERNELAGYYTRIKDTDNWSIDNDSFRFFNSLCGPFTVDRFANNINRKLKCFNSNSYCPRTSHVNAFTDDWSNANTPLPTNIEHRFCNTSFKTMQSKRSFISTSLTIFIFFAINISKWETSG